MKIKVWEGATLNEATLNLVKNIDNLDMEVEHFVIVPDRFSLLMERLLLENLPRKAMFNVSVMGLSALVTRLLSEMGIAKIETITMADALLVTAQAIKNKQDEFEIFKKSNINFCHEVYKAISQFKSSGVRAEDLQIKQGSLAQKRKYHDLGLIYAEYERLLAGRLDANGLLDYFVATLARSEALKNKKFYFAEFDSFTHKSYDVIRTLARLSDEVNIALPRSLTPANAYIYEDDILQKLKALSKELGASIEVTAPKTQLNENARLVAENLYSLSPSVTAEGNDFLSVVSAGSVQEEVEFIARLIRYKVVGGARYKDFAIACGGLEKYADMFEKFFAQLDIPYFVDQSMTADRTLLASFLFKCLDIFVKDYSSAALQAVCSDAIFADADAEKLCKTIQTYNIFGKNRYKKHFALFAPRLDKLLSLWESVDTFEGLCNVSLQVLEEYDENYLALLQKLKDQNLVKEYNINVQAKDIILDALKKIASYRGSEKCSKNEFLKQLKLLLSFKEVSSVPTYVDAVMVGDANASYFAGAANLIIVGGENLPSLSSDNGLVSDDDIEKLSVIKKIEPSIRMINRRNRFKLFNLLCSAEKSLIVSYLEVNNEGKRVEQPAYIDALSKLFGQISVPERAFSKLGKINETADLERLLLSFGNRKLAKEKGLLQGEVSEASRNLLSVPTKPLFFPKDYTKVTQLECYFNCPFKHFVRYGLRAKEVEKYEFDPRDIGNICHKLAEKYVSENKLRLGGLMEREINKFIDDNLMIAIKEEGLEEKFELTEDKESVLDYMRRLAFLLLSRITGEQRYSQFRPLYTEKSLEGNITYQGGAIKLIGKIDRIDTVDNYFRIMDYKTGAVNPILKDLYYGDKLQLFLYEDIAAKSLNSLAAGAFYFDARWDYDTEDKKDVLLKGLVLEDEIVLPLFDNRLQEGKSEIVAVSKTSKGYKGAALAKFDLSTFENYAREVSMTALNEISEGYIEPKPDASSCEKCAFRSICLFDTKKGYRKKERVTQEDIARIMEVKNAQSNF